MVLYCSESYLPSHHDEIKLAVVLWYGPIRCGSRLTTPGLRLPPNHCRCSARKRAWASTGERHSRRLHQGCSPSSRSPPPSSSSPPPSSSSPLPNSRSPPPSSRSPPPSSTSSVACAALRARIHRDVLAKQFAAGYCSRGRLRLPRQLVTPTDPKRYAPGGILIANAMRHVDTVDVPACRMQHRSG